MNKYGFVYIWRDRKHARYYIGSHWGTEDDGYVCSSFWMKQAYKLRPEDFRRRILFRTDDRVLLRQKEEEWLRLIKPEELKERERYYNLNIGGTGHWASYPDNINTIREKISYTTKQAMQREDVRNKYLEGLKTRNNKHSEEHNKKISEANMGKNKGKKRTPEQREKMRNAAIGRKHISKEHTEKAMTGLRKLYECSNCNRIMNKGNMVKHLRIYRRSGALAYARGV